MKILPKMSSTTKQTLMGSTLAGAVVGLESGMSWFVAGYPQILKNQISPYVPRNGALLADLAPAGYGLMVKKKGRGSARTQNMANGMILYDLPKLLDEFVYCIAYQMGIPSAAGMRLGNTRLNLNIRPAMTNGIAATSLSYPKTATAGKYAMKTASSSKTVATSGLGRYR